MREGAINGEIVLPHEIRPLTLPAEAEILELHHRDHRIVVVGLNEVEIVRRQLGRPITRFGRLDGL